LTDEGSGKKITSTIKIPAPPPPDKKMVVA